MKTPLIAAVIATALPATSALAQADGRFAVGAQVGTPGAGLQAQFSARSWCCAAAMTC